MLRILHAASSYPLFHGDSTAPFMEEMLTALAGRGHQVSVVVPRVKDLVEGLRHGVDVIGAPYGPPRIQSWGYGRSLDPAGRIRPTALAVTPVAVLSMARIFRRQITASSPDVVHLHWVLPQGFLAALVPRTTPLVVSLHGADARFAHGKLHSIANRVLVRTDAVVAASSAILDPYTGSSPTLRAKSHVISHGANDSLFAKDDRASARRALGLNPSTPVVLAVGRLVRKKGFHLVIGSVPLLANRNARLYIVGDGPERQSLAELIPPSLLGRIHLVGIKNREELSTWFAATDVLAVPSVPDGLDVDSGPVVLMEALAAGRPVVATRIGMAPDVIENDINGYLIDSDRPSAIAVALDRALEASDRLGDGARRSFQRIGGWDRVAGELEELYAQVIAEKGKLGEIATP